MGREHGCGKDLSSSMAMRTKLKETLLGWKYDRILNYMLLCLVTLYLSPSSFQAYPVSGISCLSSGGVKSTVNYKQVDFPFRELH